MSNKELDRLTVMKALDSRTIKQKHAAAQLGLSIRQIKRLLKDYRQNGVASLISRRRGRPSNRCLAESIRTNALDLIRKHYHDFGPTFAHEKLTENHDLDLSVETLRQWMIAEGIWQFKQRKTKQVFQMRERRSRLGELVQIDGSPHAWFEDRAETCTLIVFIDDATSQLLYLRFVQAETTQAYMDALNAYMARYGRPVSLYSDKHGVFRVNAKEATSGNGLTQFGRTLETLDIESIHANSPQAKGRVERANQTLQDRLIKEMRLQSIDSMDAGNAFLDNFRQDYNQRFAVVAKSQENAHRPVLHSEQELEIIFSIHTTRKLSKNLTIQYKNTLYQVEAQKRPRRMRHTKITVCEGFDGTVFLLYQGRKLEYSTHQKAQKQQPIENEKTINLRVNQALKKQAKRTQWKPAPDHPWRNFQTEQKQTAP
jgi:hypothetical protein